MDQRYEQTKYLVRKKILKLLGGTFEVFGDDGTVLFYSKMKAFKLREDIRVYTDETMTTEMLAIHAREIFDFNATYDIFDSPTGERIGALRRSWGSSWRDDWRILDLANAQVGSILEDSWMMALVRRYVTNLIPQTYHGEIGGTRVLTFKQNANPLVTKLSLDFSEDTGGLLDRRLGIAAGILLCAIEGKQE
jgi:hypothetical protein